MLDRIPWGRTADVERQKFQQGTQEDWASTFGKTEQSELTRGARDGYCFLAEGNSPVSFLQVFLSFDNSWPFCWVLLSILFPH